MTSWHSYPKVWNIGHAATAELFLDEVHVEEKIDGSQFSFGLIDGELKIRSKGCQMSVDDPEKMFNKAVETVKALHAAGKLTEGWTYRAEYLQKPKHNVLAYDRVPERNLIIFDVCVGEEQYLSYDQKYSEALVLGLECVPKLHQGKIDSVSTLTSLLDLTSCLGGQKIEGFVVKNYRRFGPDKKALLGKYVSEAFKEKHKVDWKEGNPGQADIVTRIVNAYRTGARWDKAIIHLREKGLLENSPKDIGALMKECRADLEAECGDEIKQALYDWAFPQIVRRCTGGLPEYYKEKLLASAFEAKEAA